MVRTISLFALAMVFAPALADDAKSKASTGQLRTWTDRSGTHQTHAALVRVIDKQVELRLKDGRLIQVPIDQLSAADKQVITTYRRTAEREHRKRRRVERAQTKSDERKRAVADKKAAAKPAAVNVAELPIKARLYGIDWYTTLGETLKTSKADVKPVFVFRALGSLSGFM